MKSPCDPGSVADTLSDLITTSELPPPLSLPPCSLCRYSDLHWASTGLALHGVFQLSPRSPGGRLVALGAAFVATIVICMYISAYSAQITVGSLRDATISGVRDLYSKPVGVPQVRIDP